MINAGEYDIEVVVPDDLKTMFALDGEVTFKGVIYMEIKQFEILHIHAEDDYEYLEYTIENGEAIVTTDRLSNFAFVVKDNSGHKFTHGGFCAGIIALILSLLALAYVLVIINKFRTMKLLICAAVVACVFLIVSIVIAIVSFCIYSLFGLFISFAIGGLCLYFLINDDIIVFKKKDKTQEELTEEKSDVDAEEVVDTDTTVETKETTEETTDDSKKEE